jgi:hypothetical protein
MKSLIKNLYSKLVNYLFKNPSNNNISIDLEAKKKKRAEYTKEYQKKDSVKQYKSD